ARAAVLLGHGYAHQPELGHALDQLLGVAVVPVDLGGPGQHLALGEVPGHLLQHLLLFGELESHDCLAECALGAVWAAATGRGTWPAACPGTRPCLPSD